MFASVVGVVYQIRNGFLWQQTVVSLSSRVTATRLLVAIQWVISRGWGHECFYLGSFGITLVGGSAQNGWFNASKRL